MKKLKDVIEGLESCVDLTLEKGCTNTCPYNDDKSGCFALKVDALACIRQLKEKIDLIEKYAPPVTPGTSIFYVAYIEDDDRCIVHESKVVEIWYNFNGWFFIEEGHKGPAHHQRHIGKSVFLDRETAQHKCDAYNEARCDSEH